MKKNTLSIPDEVRQAIRQYHEAGKVARQAEGAKSKAKAILVPFLQRLGKKGNATLAVDELRATLVVLTYDRFDGEGLYNALERSGELTSEVKAAFTRTVDAKLLFDLIDKLAVDRGTVQPFWHQEESVPSVRVTSSEDTLEKKRT